MSLITTMQQYKTAFERNWFQTYLKHTGIVSLVEQYGLDTLVIALCEVGGKKSKVERIRIKAVLNDAIKLNTRFAEGRTSLDYIQEFYEQFRQAV